MEISLTHCKGHGAFSGELLHAFHLREITGVGKPILKRCCVNKEGAHEIYNMFMEIKLIRPPLFLFHKSASQRFSYI